MKKITNERIIELLVEMELVLDEKETYKDCFTRMLCYTKEGYKLMLNYHENIKKKKVPHFVSKYNPFSIENMKIWVKMNEPDYEILDDKYIASDSPLTWRINDENLSDFQMTWVDFYSIGRRHPYFSKQRELEHAERLRKTPEQVRKEVDYYLNLNGNKYGWKLNEGEEYKYRRAAMKMNFTDTNDYKSKTSLASLKEGRNPVHFHKRLVETSTHNMYKWIEENTPYKFSENQLYRGNEERYVFICGEHGEFTRKFSNMKNNGGCGHCWLESVSGENSRLWNENLTEEERIENRDYNEYHKWRKQVYERDDHTCQCCAKRGGNLNAHHLDGFGWCKERRTDVSNGITLCIDCHNYFHLCCGNKGNYEQQFINWLDQMKQFIYYDKLKYQKLVKNTLHK